MSIGLIGEKIGMTRIFCDDGTVIPVTVIKAGPCPVVEKKTIEKHGYTALKLGYREVKEGKMSLPAEGVFKKKNLAPCRYVHEFRCDESSVEEGATIDVTLFKENEYIDITGISTGKGFQGVVKRHGFTGGKKTHGHHGTRQAGSIGMCAWPSKVLKGHKMPGQMGNKRRTVHNVKIVRVDSENNLLLVKGSIIGKPRSIVYIRKALKKQMKATVGA